MDSHLELAIQICSFCGAHLPWHLQSRAASGVSKLTCAPLEGKIDMFRMNRVAHVQVRKNFNNSSANKSTAQVDSREEIINCEQ